MIPKVCLTPDQYLCLCKLLASSNCTSQTGTGLTQVCLLDCVLLSFLLNLRHVGLAS